MADDPSYLETNRRTLRARFVYWTAEVILVFVGVSAAFWLNNYQQHAQEAQQRDRILASLERTLEQGIASGKVNATREEQERAEFQRALDAGEMPPLRPYIFTTDYSPGDFAALLQSGGVQLLDVETLMALRNDETVIRWGLSRLQRYQKLSDELIVPNLAQDISFFYDPATKKLRKQFEIPRLYKRRCNSRATWIEPTPSCSNASRPSGIGKGVRLSDGSWTQGSRSRHGMLESVRDCAGLAARLRSCHPMAGVARSGRCAGGNLCGGADARLD
jgi:hypothetical protein